MRISTILVTFAFKGLFLVSNVADASDADQSPSKTSSEINTSKKDELISKYAKEISEANGWDINSYGGSRDYKEIMKLISEEIAEEKLPFVVDAYLRSKFLEDTSVYDTTRWLKALNKFPQEKFTAYFDALDKISQITYFDKCLGVRFFLEGLIEIIAPIPADRIEIIPTAMNILCNEGASTYHVGEYIKVFSNTPKENIINVANTSKILKQHLDKGYDLDLKVLKTLSTQSAGCLDILSTIFNQNKTWRFYECETLIKALGKIPADQAEEILGAVFKVAHKNKYASSWVDAIDKISRIPSSKLNTALEALDKVNGSSDWPPHYSCSILKKLSFLPEDHLEKVITPTNKLNQGKDVQEVEIKNAAGILACVPLDRWTDLNNTAERIVEQKKWHEVSSEVLFALAQVPENILDSVLSVTENVEQCDPLTYCLIIAKLKDLAIEPKKISTILPAVVQLTQGKPNWFHNDQNRVFNILDSLIELPEDRLDDIIDSIITITNKYNWDDPSDNGCASLIKALSKVPFEKKERVIELADEIIAPTMKQVTVYWVLKQNFLMEIANPVVDPMAYVKDCVKKCMLFYLQGNINSPKLGAAEYSRIISGTSLIPEDREEEITKAIKFIVAEKITTGWTIGKIIEELIKITPDHTNKVCLACSALSNDNEELKHYIIKYLSEVNPDMLETVVKATNRLAKNTFGWRKPDIVRTFANCTPENLKKVVTACITLTESLNITEFELDSLISSLSRLPQDKMNERLVDAVKFVSLAKCKMLELPDIIRGVSDVPKERLQEIFSAVVKLTSERYDEYGNALRGYDYNQIMRASLNIPSDRLNHVLAAVQLVRTGIDRLCGWSCARLLNALGRVPEPQLDAVSYAVFASTKGNKWNKFEEKHAKAIEALGKLSSDHLDAVLKCTRRVYTPFVGLKDLCDLDCLNVMETFSKFSIDNIKNIEETLGSFLTSKIKKTEDMCGIKIRNTYDYETNSICEALAYIPESHLTMFLPFAMQLKDDSSLISFSSKLLCEYPNFIALSDISLKNEIFGYWKSILEDEDVHRSTKLVDVITQNLERLGLNEDYPLVQLAIRVGIVIDDKHAENPFQIYKKLKEKKDEEIDWKSIPKIKGFFENKQYSLLPEGIWRFCQALEFDLNKAPNFSHIDYIGLLDGLKNKLLDNQFCSKVIGIGDIHELVRNAENPLSHINVLLNAPTKTRVGCYLQCILHNYHSMENDDDKYTCFASFLSSVRGCNTGMESPIEEVYYKLPFQAMVQDQVNAPWVKENSSKAIGILSIAIQKITMDQFSDGSVFIKKACGLPESESVIQASHQIQTLRGLIGSKVGLPSELKFDLHGQHIYETILGTSCQTFIELYYLDLSLESFILRLRNKINEESMQLFQKNKDVYAHFGRFLDYKEECIEMRYKDKEDLVGEWTGLTNTGVVSMIKRVGILEEHNKVLPW